MVLKLPICCLINPVSSLDSFHCECPCVAHLLFLYFYFQFLYTLLVSFIHSHSHADAHPCSHEHVCVEVIVMLVVMGCICASVYPQWLQSKITPVMHAGCEWWFSAHRGTISQTQPLKPLHSFSACLSVSRNICLLIKVCLHSTVCLADGYIKKYSYVLTSCVAWWFSANLLLIKQERQEWSCTVQKEECLYTSMYKYLDPFVF